MSQENSEVNKEQEENLDKKTAKVQTEEAVQSESSEEQNDDVKEEAKVEKKAEAQNEELAEEDEAASTDEEEDVTANDENDSDDEDDSIADDSEVDSIIAESKLSQPAFDWDKFEAEEDEYSHKERESLAKTYDQTLSTITENEVVDGVVVTLTKREVVVNIGYKSDGIVNVNEFRYNPDLKQGDTVEDFVE